MRTKIIRTFLVTVACMLAFNIGMTTSQAASQRDKALKAYKSFLIKDKKFMDKHRKGYEVYRFALEDVNRDGIPELFVDHGRTGNMENLYAYNGKKVKFLIGVGHGAFKWINTQKGILKYFDQSCGSRQKTVKHQGDVRGYMKIYPKAKYSILGEKIWCSYEFSGTKYYLDEKPVKKSEYKKKTKRFENKKGKIKYHVYSENNLSKYLR